MKNINSLIKVARAIRIEKQRIVFAAETEIVRLQNLLVVLQEEHAKECVLAASDYEVGRFYPAYQKKVNIHAAKLNQQIRGQEIQIERARSEVVEAHREVRKYELIKEAMDKRAQAERNRREQMELDEIALEYARHPYGLARHL